MHEWTVVIYKKGPMYRFLRKPRWSTYDQKRAETSRFAWRYFSSQPRTLYTLSILGILHGLTGLTLYLEDDDYVNGHVDKA